ncbi:hypothetical protein PC116_g19715 [Phytophthora cactorum]|uniref:Uncharacterized protein n=1 Tax=Phytophthora cactorum TaxID=29920 RepID=A0A8T1K569_9STRA|nr:hypothetical protein Pcac1_g4755 [Phytophthora cactorum]KAG2886371.1 hypothetical protein PC117_g25396 [Phytophthora cactorum]KAG2890689.1 hypothetical protein PC114_g17346 [Phytophthora cactorum]KAG2964359.1 hypothetical protein PC119_g25277 [Phytophthora cactorum]KAG3148344.1 hypothetical protein C6341_g17440 [Phytophthora cactorum]
MRYHPRLANDRRDARVEFVASQFAGTSRWSRFGLRHSITDTPEPTAA